MNALASMSLETTDATGSGADLVRVKIGKVWTGKGAQA
jgi:hypothetical protein